MTAILSTVSAFLVLNVGHCMAEVPWSTGSSLLEVIGYDLHAHDSHQKLTDYQTNSVCLLLGYFRGFAESAALASHYNASALPFFLPDSITSDQIERSVYSYLTDNPDKLNLTGGAIVAAALSRDFPNFDFKAVLSPAAEQSPSPPIKPVDKLSKSLISGS